MEGGILTGLGDRHARHREQMAYVEESLLLMAQGLRRVADGDQELKELIRREDDVATSDGTPVIDDPSRSLSGIMDSAIARVRDRQWVEPQLADAAPVAEFAMPVDQMQAALRTMGLRGAVTCCGSRAPEIPGGKTTEWRERATCGIERLTSGSLVFGGNPTGPLKGRRELLRIKLGDRRYVGDAEATDTFLPRRHAGWDPTMTDGEVYDAARGWWRVNARAEQERYALVLAGGQIRMAIAIKEWATAGDRRAFAGDILGPSDPVHDKFVGGGDPTESTSRFPVLYWSDAIDEATCRCGCGETVTRGDWSQGHDQRAIHDRIRADFGGSVSRFIDWYDANGPFAASDQDSPTPRPAS